jgi:hypothetical protein
MPRGLYYKSWEDIQQEMSIAGSPEKMVHAGKMIMGAVTGIINSKNIPEHINMIFALKRVIAELEGNQRRLENEHSNAVAKQLSNK